MANLFVGNLSYDATEEDLRDVFVQNGYDVIRTSIVKDRETGRTRGFGFVEVDSECAVNRVVDDMDGVMVMGRPIRVNEARERERSSNGGRRTPVVAAPVETRRGNGHRHRTERQKDEYEW